MSHPEQTFTASGMPSEVNESVSTQTAPFLLLHSRYTGNAACLCFPKVVLSLLWVITATQDDFFCGSFPFFKTFASGTKKRDLIRGEVNGN